MHIRDLVVLSGFCVTLSAMGKNLKVGRLTCNLREGIVIVDDSLRLGWTLTSPEKGTVQTAYEIMVKEDFTGRTVWNSGKVISNQSQLVPVTIPDLKEGNRYRYVWKVRVWDEAGLPSPWSDECVFRTMPDWSGSKWVGAITRKNAHLPEGRNYHGSELKKPEVKAAWAAADSLSRKSIYLRKGFEVRKKMVEATVYVSGLGFYELSINGQKVGDAEFAPLWSDYDKTVFYNTYDVTSFLKKGGNAIGVLLGNGFYNEQGGRYRKLQISFGPPTLLLKLVVNYQDGTQEVISSDPSWKYALSPLTFNSLYGGEDYDARLEQKNWNSTEFNDKNWLPVVVQEAPGGVLRPQQALPVKIMERYDVRRITHLTKEQVEQASVTTKRQVDGSAVVLDMGQNLAGFPEIKVRGKRGQRVTLLVAESLTKEGACNQRQTGRPYYYTYTLKGNGVETWHPRFSYYGFRYIQVEGAVLKGEANKDNLPVIEQVQSCFVYNSAPKVSTFECSNPIFNAAHRLIEKAVRSNMQSVFTDCPHREKLGWLEQDHLNGPGLFYNYDLTGFGAQLMQDMADAQHPDGAMPTTAPEYVRFEGPGMDAFAESPEWGDALVIFPFMYADFYGDNALIRKFYPNMRRYVDYLATRADNNILSFGLGDWYDYGNFRAGFSRNTPVPLVATAHYYMAVDYLSKAAKLLGNTFDVDYYTNLKTCIATSFNNKFLDKATSQYGTGSQCSNALPLFLGLTGHVQDGKWQVDSLLRRNVLQNLINDIKAHGDRLTTGDVGNRYLIQALSRNGQNELVYKMFNHEDAPGYGFQLKFGATTLTEQWDPRQGSSWNHFMMGQIDEWFFRSLAGIIPSQGYKSFRIAPQPVGDLKYVNASCGTPYGLVKVNWEQNGGKFVLNVSVPVNTCAEIIMPGKKEIHKVSGGDYRFSIEQ